MINDMETIPIGATIVEVEIRIVKRRLSEVEKLHGLFSIEAADVLEALAACLKRQKGNEEIVSDIVARIERIRSLTTNRG